VYFIWHLLMAIQHLGVPDVLAVLLGYPPTRADDDGKSLCQQPAGSFSVLTAWIVVIQALYFCCAAAGDVLQVLLPTRWRPVVTEQVDRFFLVFWTLGCLSGGASHIVLLFECCSNATNALWLMHAEFLWYALIEALLVPHDCGPLLADAVLASGVGTVWYVFYWLYHASTGGYVYGANLPLWMHIGFASLPFVYFAFRLIWRARLWLYFELRRHGLAHWIGELDRRRRNVPCPETSLAIELYASPEPEALPIMQMADDSTSQQQQQQSESESVSWRQEVLYQPSCHAPYRDRSRWLIYLPAMMALLLPSLFVLLMFAIFFACR